MVKSKGILSKKCILLVLAPCIVTLLVYSHFNDEVADLQEKARILTEEHYRKELARNKQNSIHIIKDSDKYANLHIAPYKLPSQHMNLAADEGGLWSSVHDNNFYNFDQKIESAAEDEDIIDEWGALAQLDLLAPKPSEQQYNDANEDVFLQKPITEESIAQKPITEKPVTERPATQKPEIENKQISVVDPSPDQTIDKIPSTVTNTKVDSAPHQAPNTDVVVRTPKMPGTKYDHLPKERVTPDRRRHVVFYNIVPKTGSMTLTHQFSHLITSSSNIDLHCFKTVNNYPRLSLKYQYNLVWNITHRTTQKPLVVYGQTAHIDFGQFGAFEPIYITVLREPLERLLSHYYYNRYGDDYLKNWVWDKRNIRESFDECFTNNHASCATRHLWVQIPHLCGQNPACWQVNSEWALKEAKRNLLTKYFLVGVTEQMKDFMDVLDANLPSVFQDLSINYEKDKQAEHLRKTLKKEAMSNSTMAWIKNTKTYQMERELYDFAQKQFNYVKRFNFC